MVCQWLLKIDRREWKSSLREDKTIQASDTFSVFQTECLKTIRENQKSESLQGKTEDGSVWRKKWSSHCSAAASLSKIRERGDESAELSLVVRSSTRSASRLGEKRDNSSRGRQLVFFWPQFQDLVTKTQFWKFSFLVSLWLCSPEQDKAIQLVKIKALHWSEWS